MKNLLSIPSFEDGPFLENGSLDVAVVMHPTTQKQLLNMKHLLSIETLVGNPRGQIPWKDKSGVMLSMVTSKDAVSGAYL